MKQSHHVISSMRSGWSVLRSDRSRASRTFEKRDDAVVYARDRARRDGTNLFIHRPDGTVESMHRFGDDVTAPEARRPG